MLSTKYEIVAMVHKNYGQKVIENMNNDTGVESIIVAYGRSSDLFDDKQFGQFGEAAYITLLTDEENKDKIFEKLYEICELRIKHTGIIFSMVRENCSTDYKVSSNN